MTGRISLPSLVVLAVLVGSASFVTANAFAQNAGSDEAVNPRGAVVQNVALTPAQKSAIYNAVSEQRQRAPAASLEPAVGAPVSPAVQLSELPEQAGIDDGIYLKYAMVADDVVVVDPISMRVVDIISGHAKP